MSIRESFLVSPEEYDREKNEQLVQNYMEQLPSNLSADREPDIIVVMDEAYSDLSVLGERFVEMEEISPFIQGLSENTIKGYALTSAFGGRTANAEYEFLTGSSMAFAPKGAIAYQQFVNDNSFSMASELKERGYDTLAMHPYIANGWMRDSVWPKLGFEQCLFRDDFEQKNLLRRFVSDREMTEKIIEIFENRTEENPLFLFGVTMQNHSPFDYVGEDFSSDVLLTGYENAYPEAEQYLSLLRDTDKAVEQLIAHFGQVDRETVIVFFGDHLPALDQRFYEEIHGGPFEGLDEQMQQYMVPFFVWANYDIPEQEVECTSLNYLSTLIYEVAGIRLSPYHRFLNDMEQVIPCLNLNGYYSQDREEFLSVDEAEGGEEEWLQADNSLQYEYMKGKGNPDFYLG